MEAFLLENLPILLCFLFGVALLIVEVFLPGFGLPGISGIVLEGAAIVLTYLWHGGLAALGVTVLILAIGSRCHLAGAALRQPGTAV